jgi:Tfp pilus assembly protein PilO
VGRRGPIVAGVVAVLVSILAVFFLVLPKMKEVSDARTELDRAQSERQTLESRLRALEDARDNADRSQRIIARVDNKIPPTADVPSMILLLDNAASQSSLTLTSFTPNTPVLDETSGFSRIDVAVSVTGTYFGLTDFLFHIETLTRAAKVLNISISPAQAGDTGSSLLTLQATVEMYTSDTSAGPGSEPGPTEGG